MTKLSFCSILWDLKYLAWFLQSDYFQDRAYELSPQGLKALVEVTEHPSYAQHIRTVVVIQGGRNGPAKYHGLIDQAFKNLAAFGKPISIGFRYAQITRNFQTSWISAVTSINKFLRDTMLAAANRTTMLLGPVIVDVEISREGWRNLQTLRGLYITTTAAASYSILEAQAGLPQGLKVQFPSEHWGSDASSHILVTDNSKRLEVRNIPFNEVRIFCHLFKNLREIVIDSCRGRAAKLNEGQYQQPRTSYYQQGRCVDAFVERCFRLSQPAKSPTSSILSSGQSYEEQTGSLVRRRQQSD